MFSNHSVLLEERITELESDVFINCSVNYGTEYNITSWLFDYNPLPINQTSKYYQNTSGLTIYNITELDVGDYICYVDEIWAIIHVQIASKIRINYYWLRSYIYMPIIILCVGPPVLVSKQNLKAKVNLREEVVLNCTVSSLPAPVYSWSTPDSCSSCPNTRNNSVLTFTAEDITVSGEYTCVAENQYGNLSVTFNVMVISK